MSKWPKDNQAALISFYGNPGSGAVANQLIKVVPPFKMYYDGTRVANLLFHKKAAPALLAALNKAWDYYGQDQEKVNAVGISKTAGTYNKRYIRGSSSKWSNHAYGAAIDINAEENGFNVTGNIPLVLIAAFKSEGARWGGDYRGRKDPMHFEFCDSGEPQRTFEQWLEHYGVPEVESPPMAVVDTNGIELAADDDEGDDGVDAGDQDMPREPIPVPRRRPEVVPIADPTPTVVETRRIPVEAATLAPGIYYTVKSAFKSKMSWFTGGLGSASATTAVASDPDTRGLLIQLISKPMFWMAVLCLILATYVVYLRWREYGRGNPENIVKAR
jgi:hypothetical protein